MGKIYLGPATALVLTFLLALCFDAVAIVPGKNAPEFQGQVIPVVSTSRFGVAHQYPLSTPIIQNSSLLGIELGEGKSVLENVLIDSQIMNSLYQPWTSHWMQEFNILKKRKFPKTLPNDPSTTKKSNGKHVPEPGILFVLGSGLLGLLIVVRMDKVLSGRES